MANHLSFDSICPVPVHCQCWIYVAREACQCEDKSHGQSVTAKTGNILFFKKSILILGRLFTLFLPPKFPLYWLANFEVKCFHPEKNRSKSLVLSRLPRFIGRAWACSLPALLGYPAGKFNFGFDPFCQKCSSFQACSR